MSSVGPGEPVEHVVGLSTDEDETLRFAASLAGRTPSDVLMDGGLSLARRIVAEHQSSHTFKRRYTKEEEVFLSRFPLG